MENEIKISDIQAVRNRRTADSIAKVVTGDVVESDKVSEVSEKTEEETNSNE